MGVSSYRGRRGQNEEGLQQLGVHKLGWVSSHRWREVQDIRDKTLFVGSKASFMATATKPKMVNMLCLSKFAGDFWNELSCHHVGVDVNAYNEPLTRRDRHMQLCAVPKGVGFGYDRSACKCKNIVLSLITKI